MAAGGTSRLLPDWCMYAVVGRLKRWRLPLPADAVGRRRAGLTALALLAVTAAAVVLLAVVFRLRAAAAVTGIIGILTTGPGAYLAWAALPDRRTPVHGRLAGRWDPVDLGVHQVIGGGPMPTYVRRQHDDLLRAVLDPAVPASRLVVVRGVSSTGKTRAAGEQLSAPEVAARYMPGLFTA